MVPSPREFIQISVHVHRCLAFILLRIINLLLSNKSARSGTVLCNHVLNAHIGLSSYSYQKLVYSI